MFEQTKKTDTPDPATHPYEYAQWYCLQPNFGAFVRGRDAIEVTPCGACVVCLPCNALGELLKSK